MFGHGGQKYEGMLMGSSVGWIIWRLGVGSVMGSQLGISVMDITVLSFCFEIFCLLGHLVLKDDDLFLQPHDSIVIFLF